MVKMAFFSKDLTLPAKILKETEPAGISSVLDAREVFLELVYDNVCNKSTNAAACIDGGLSQIVD